MYKCFPYDILIKICIIFLMCYYFLIQISIINKLHHNTTYKHPYHKELASIKECLYPTIYGEFNDAKIRTSFNAFSCYLSDKLFIFTFFNAQIEESTIRCTLYTLEYAPYPNFDTITKSFSDISPLTIIFIIHIRTSYIRISYTSKHQ